MAEEVNPLWERINKALDCAYAYGNLMERIGRADAYLDVVCYPLPGDIEWETSKKKYTREFLKQYPFLDDLRKWYGIRAMNALEEFLLWLNTAQEKGLVRAGMDMDRFRIPIETMAKRLFDFWAGKDYEAPYDAKYILEHEKLINKVADLHQRIVEKTLGKTLKQLEKEEREQRFYREIL